MSRGKICFAVAHFSAGGMPKYVLNSVRAAIELGYETAVYARFDYGYYHMRDALLKVDGVRYEQGLDLLGFCEEFKPDIIHGHDWLWERPNLPSVDTVHTVDPTFIAPVTRVDTDIFILLNPMQKTALRTHPNRVFVPTFIDEREFDPSLYAGTKTAVRAKYGLPPESKLAVMVGLVCPNKRQADYARQWNVENGYLVILGALADNTKEYWEPLVNDVKGKRVIFMGLKKDVPELLSAMDLFLMGSALECASMASLEAACLGLPVVLRRNHSADMYFKKERDPIASLANNDTEVFSEIRRLFSDESAAKGMGERARAHVLEHHGMELFKERIDPMYQALLERGRTMELGGPPRHVRSKKIACMFNFSKGARAIMIGPAGYKYQVTMRDGESGRVLLDETLEDRIGIGAKVYSKEKFYVPWDITVKHEQSGQETKFKLDLKDKDVFVVLDTRALGDTLAYMPYLEDFHWKHDCEMHVSTHWNCLFRPLFPDYDFYEPTFAPKAPYAVYWLGVYDNDYGRNKSGWRHIPLQQAATDILGVPYEEKHLDLRSLSWARAIGEKYVCIAHASTMKAKEWNRKGGWQEVIDYLVSKGYVVVPVSREKHDFKHVYDGEVPPEITRGALTYIHHSEFFLGLPSGLSWLAAALRKKVFMITGFSIPPTEFTQDTVRIQNTDVCNGCYNDGAVTFERGNFDWCPRGQDFVCTRSITPEVVIEKLEEQVSG